MYYAVLDLRNLTKPGLHQVSKNRPKTFIFELDTEFYYEEKPQLCTPVALHDTSPNLISSSSGHTYIQTQNEPSHEINAEDF